MPVGVRTANRMAALPVYLFGVMVTVNLAVGANTPPVGVDLIAACKVGQTTLDDAWPYIWPFVGAMVVALAFVTFFPGLVTVLPRLLMK